MPTLSELKLHKAERYSRNVKATIQKSGRMGFSSAAIKLMGVDNNSHIGIFTNDNDPSDDNLYLMLTDKPQEGFFKVKKAGKYYALDARELFQTLGYDYKNYSIIFDVSEQKIDGRDMFVLNKRTKPRKARS